MYRNAYNAPPGYAPSSQPPQFRQTASSGFGSRAPLYPIGPTLTQPEFKPIQRGYSPSPYLSKEGVRPPSYESRYLQRAETFAGQMNVSYEERERRLIERNEKEIQEEQKRREQIRISYERQIKALSAKLNRNLEKKEKLHGEIENLQSTHNELNEKLRSLRPPQRNSDNYQSIDRKQQQMIILKNKLMSSMRQTETELNSQQEEQEQHWEEQVSQKQKQLFHLEQILREKRLELHSEKQKSFEKPDFLSIEEEVRAKYYIQFMQNYEQLEKKLKNLYEQRQATSKQLRDTIDLKKPQLHNLNVRRQEISKERTGLQLRVEQLQRISAEMEVANENLMKELERKQMMITKYRQDIEELKSKKQEVEADISELAKNARERDFSTISKPLTDIFSKLQEDIRGQQAKGARLKNAYQKLYELLSSAVSRDIHSTFNQAVIA